MLENLATDEETRNYIRILRILETEHVNNQEVTGSAVQERNIPRFHFLVIGIIMI